VTDAAADATSKAALLTVTKTASTDATAASDSVTVSEGANTDNISTDEAAAKIGKKFGDGVVGRAKYDIASGRLTFTAKPTAAPIKNNWRSSPPRCFTGARILADKGVMDKGAGIFYSPLSFAP